MSYVGFYERITLDVLRLLKGNTRAQIRNTVFEIIVKMLRDQIDRNGLPGNPHVVTQKIKMRMPGFDQPLEASLECQHLEVHLNTLILPAADSIIQETFATNPSANQLPRKAFENTMKILSMMVRAEHLLHKWITSRMLNHFPMEHGNVNIELDVVIINLRFAKLYAKSYRSTYNHPNAVEPVLRQRIEDYVIKVFTEQGHPRGIEGMELAVKTVVAVKSMGLDLFKYVVNYLERTRFTDRKKLGVLATVFKYLERDFDESSKVIINFAMDNMTNILDQLLKQVPEASSCDLTLGEIFFVILLVIIFKLFFDLPSAAAIQSRELTSSAPLTSNGIFTNNFPWFSLNQLQSSVFSRFLSNRRFSPSSLYCPLNGYSHCSIGCNPIFLIFGRLELSILALCKRYKY